jgi:NhaP-type Na+/H+ or K+/H+ antiporter
VTEDILLDLAAIMVLGVCAQWLAWRVRVPSILLLLIIGFLAGPATRFLDPDELLGDLLIPVVSLSVAVILFEGGLTLRIEDLPRVGGVVRNLISLGVLVTWGISAAAAYLILDLSVSLSVLLGAIVVVTGPTVVGPLLQHVRPTGQVGPILRWEGIVIDPIGAMLAVLAFEAILVGEVGEATNQAVGDVLFALAAGLGIGAIAAGVITLLLQRFWIPDALQNPVTLVAVVAALTAANHIQSESGLLAVTVMGIAMANQKAVTVRHIVEFKENLRVLLIAGLFILLAARLQMDDIRSVGFESLGFLAVLIFVARPAAVALSTVRSGLSWRERAFLSWMAPRGIVAAAIASIFALRLAEVGEPGAERLVPLAFVVIVGTITVYGLSASAVARWLKVADPNPQGVLMVGAHGWAQEIAKALQGLGLQVMLVDANWDNVTAARMAGLPTHYASILSDYATEEIDLGGIGRMVALTPNDEVNLLAAQRFAPTFGRAEVYQLPPKSAGGGERGEVTQHLRGRLLFGDDVGYSVLSGRFASGAVVKTTTLSDEFGYEAFLELYGEETVPLFVLTEAGRLRPVCADTKPAPKPGQKVISVLYDVEEGPNLKAEKKKERPVISEGR